MPICFLKTSTSVFRRLPKGLWRTFLWSCLCPDRHLQMDSDQHNHNQPYLPSWRTGNTSNTCKWTLSTTTTTNHTCLPEEQVTQVLKLCLWIVNLMCMYTCITCMYTQLVFYSLGRHSTYISELGVLFRGEPLLFPTHWWLRDRRRLRPRTVLWSPELWSRRHNWWVKNIGLTIFGSQIFWVQSGPVQNPNPIVLWSQRPNWWVIKTWMEV